MCRYVKEFTVDLAAMITGNKHVEHMLAQGMETGNFFEKMGEKDGIWRCKDPMRWSMEQRLHKKRSSEQIRRLYYNAGLYYELEGDLPKALEMYKIYDDTESISRLLVANARKMQPAAITTNCGNTIWSFRRRSSGKIRF